MAKSARASITKRNNQRLKKKVFGPVESARNERLNAKLLELASQPKPPRSEMEVEEEGTSLANKATLAMLPQTKSVAGAKKPAGKEGAFRASFSVSIPDSLLDDSNAPRWPLPTPRSTPEADDLGSRTRRKVEREEAAFYHILGTSAKILGFDVTGELELKFMRPEDM